MAFLVRSALQITTFPRCSCWTWQGRLARQGAGLHNPEFAARRTVARSGLARRNKRYCLGRQPVITASSQSEKVKVLFVCLGNICRSPTAEATFKASVKRARLEDKFFIDSCGLGGGNEDWYLDNGWSYHEGHRADARMRETAALRGLELTSRSRPLKPEDLTHFDYILGMDFENMALMQLAADHWAETKPIPKGYRNKVKLMCSFMPEDSQFKGIMEVPDPYFDDDKERRGFHRVLDLLNDACQGLLQTAITEHNLQA